MGKGPKKHGDGGGTTGKTLGRGVGGGVQAQGGFKKAPLPSTAVKKKNFSGLSFLDRGSSEFRGKQKQEDRKRLLKEEKKKRGLQRLLQEQGQPSALFQELTKDELDDDEDSESISSGGLSDEEVSSGLITFKDPEVQRAWSPPREEGGKKEGGKKKKGGGKEERAAVPSKKIAMEVPEWGEEEDEEEDEEEERTKKGGQKDGPGKKRQGETAAGGGGGGGGGGEKKQKGLLDVLSQKAEAKKKLQQEERERERAEKEKAVQGRLAYFAKRKKDRAMHMKKTAKGQPVLKNVISGILSKLQAE